MSVDTVKPFIVVDAQRLRINQIEDSHWSYELQMYPFPPHSNIIREERETCLECARVHATPMLLLGAAGVLAIMIYLCYLLHLKLDR